MDLSSMMDDDIMFSPRPAVDNMPEPSSRRPTNGSSIAKVAHTFFSSQPSIHFSLEILAFYWLKILHS